LGFSSFKFELAELCKVVVMLMCCCTLVCLRIMRVVIAHSFMYLYN
jgi:hypothetical protein